MFIKLSLKKLFCDPYIKINLNFKQISYHMYVNSNYTLTYANYINEIAFKPS